MFIPIERNSDLPSVGTSNERRTIDFKSHGTDDRYEIAKDVAAFANADGGTILVGARASGEYLMAYAPLSLEDASAVQRTCEEAIRNRCSPIPLFDIVGLALDGGTIVAVNVWPFPGQPVGVEIKKGEAKCGKRGVEPEGLYFFPLRVGAHTISIAPEQMPMFTDSRVRRIAICLQQAVGQRVVLSSPTRRSDGSKSHSGSRTTIWMETARLDKVDILGNSITVSIAMRSEGDGVAVSLPLDLIDAAWKDEPLWRILIRGRIEEMAPGSESGTPDLDGIRLFFDADG